MLTIPAMLVLALEDYLIGEYSNIVTDNNAGIILYFTDLLSTTYLVK